MSGRQPDDKKRFSFSVSFKRLLASIAIRQFALTSPIPPATAEVAIKLALREARRIEPDCSGTAALSEILRVCLTMGELKEAWKIAAEVEEEFGPASSIYEQIALSQIHQQDIRQGWSTFQKIARIDPQNRVSPLCEIALALHKQQTELSP